MTNRQRIWIVGVSIALTAAIVFLATSVVRAQDIDLPIDTRFRGDPGDLFPIATIPAKPGLDCVAELEGRNNNSIHPDNDILAGPVTFTDVENGTFKAAALTFVSTGPIDVAVRLGGDGVFSAGFTLEVTCNPPTTTTPTTTSLPSSSTTTTTAPDSSSTTVPLAPSTTLSEPPVGGIATGGGACADGSCDGWSLSPLTTWLLIGGVWFLLAGLAWSYLHYRAFGDTE